VNVMKAADCGGLIAAANRTVLGEDQHRSCRE